MAIYKIKQGDCISSIAFDRGFFPDTLWNHSENAALKKKCKDANVLLPGDTVFIPEKEPKTENCTTEQKHRFRKKSVPAHLRIRFLDTDDQPYANEKYILEIDGETINGATDQDGLLDESIPPGARKGKVVIGKEQDEFFLLLGRIDPIDTTRGIQGRLQNLGFYRGEEDGEFGPKTEAAVKSFQQKHKLEITGKSDEVTLKKLEDIHGS